jgi:hypothetical protein
LQKIDPLIKRTQKVVNVKNFLVEDVIKYQFSYTRKFLTHPDRALLKLPELGMFKADYPKLRKYLWDSIKGLRKDRSEYRLAEFRKWWAYYKEVQRYKISLKNRKKRKLTWKD